MITEKVLQMVLEGFSSHKESSSGPLGGYGGPLEVSSSQRGGTRSSLVVF